MVEPLVHNHLIPNDKIWKYQITATPLEKPRLDIRHEWSLSNGKGAISIWASYLNVLGFESWYGGIERHGAAPPKHNPDEAPSQEHCHLLNGPCWHDGSSLQFENQIKGVLPKQGDEDWSSTNMPPRVHQLITLHLVSYHKMWFADEEDSVDDSK
jgi:hypothetical protein